MVATCSAEGYFTKVIGEGPAGKPRSLDGSITTEHDPALNPISAVRGVTGEAILGANIFKDFFAGIRDIVGGRSAAYENELRRQQIRRCRLLERCG